MGQTHTVGKTATTVVTGDDGVTRCTYHQTVVVAWGNGKIVLDSGGWKTATTKLRRNQCANEYWLPFSVYQKDYEWFVETGGKVLPFKDGMVINLAY